MIKIHHLSASQSDRIVWLMEELSLPYEFQWHQRGEDSLAPDSYRALHPAGTAPIIEDGEIVLAESLAIVEYIVNRYGDQRLTVPTDHKAYPDYLYWMAFSQSYSANLMTGFMGAPETLPEGMPRIMAGLSVAREQRGLTHMNEHLGSNDYLAGREFSLADIMNIFPLTSMRLFIGRSMEAYPNIEAYIARIVERPSYVKAMAIAGPTVESNAQ